MEDFFNYCWNARSPQVPVPPHVQQQVAQYHAQAASVPAPAIAVAHGNGNSQVNKARKKRKKQG